MKNLIKKVHEFVRKNCEYYYFEVEWDEENELFGLSVFKVDDDYNNEYKQQAEVIKNQIEKEFGIEIYNYCEPSSYEVECLDVRRQVYMELDELLTSDVEWLDYGVCVSSEWDGKFRDEYEDDEW